MHLGQLWRSAKSVVPARLLWLVEMLIVIGSGGCWAPHPPALSPQHTGARGSQDRAGLPASPLIIGATGSLFGIEFKLWGAERVVQAKTEETRPVTTWSRRGKWIVSVLVVVQLLAVTAEPFRFFTRSVRGTSPAADPVRWLLAPYIEFAYLSHGYFFFAPEPGPSHLMECRLTLPDQQQVSLMFPDKHKQWPRLLYHRHFMLSEFLHQLHWPPVDAELVANDGQLARDWQSQRQVFEQVRSSYSQHVAAKFGAQSVAIERVEHRLPSDDEVFRQRLPLDSPTLYVTLPDAPPDGVPPVSSALQPFGQPAIRPTPGIGVLRNPEVLPSQEVQP